MSALLDALGWVGESLDKPGRAVKGALGGQGLGAFKNLIPFSDTAGWTDPSQAVSGRDLLQRWGAVGADDPNEGIGLDDIAGFGVEMALDPTNFIGLGTLKHLRNLGRMRAAASPAGEIAQAAPSIAKGWASAPLDKLRSSVARFLGEEAGTPAYRETMLGLRPVTSETLDLGLGAGARLRPMAERVSRFKNVEMLDPGQTDQLLALSRAGGEVPFGMYGTVLQKGASSPVGFTAEAAHVAPGKSGGRALARALRAGISEEELAARNIGGLQGMYFPGTEAKPASTAFTMRGAIPEAIRHEVGGHAFTREAARSGMEGELPFVGRMAARLQGPYPPASGERGVRSGLGMLLDELGAFSKEARNPWSQAGSGLKFLFGGSPAGRAEYIQQFARQSPLVAELYRDLPYLPYVGLGAAGVGAGGYLFGGE